MMGIRIHQRGFLLPTWAIYALAAAAALGALWWAASALDARGYARGKAETTAAYAQRDNAALQAALARVAELQAEVQAREHTHAAALGQIRDRNQRETAHAQSQHEADLAALRAGTLRLRDPGAAAGPACSDRSPAPAPAGTAGGGDAAPRAELSPAAAGFLLSLMREADAVTRQLGDAQDVIRAQIRACNGS